MKTFLACLGILTAGVSGFADVEGSAGKSHPPFELTFVRRLAAAESAPVWDPKLPGYRLDAEIATVKIRPLAGHRPEKLVLRIRTSAGMPPMLEGFSLQAPGRKVSTGLKMTTEEIQTGATPGPTELKERSYFAMKVVGKEVEVIFLPKAMKLLKDECIVTWVDWYRQ
ncbi:MAG: hypothetical protein ACKV19_00320 [Verrucomicrobiales bacterium]